MLNRTVWSSQSNLTAGACNVLPSLREESPNESSSVSGKPCWVNKAVLSVVVQSTHTFGFLVRVFLQ